MRGWQGVIVYFRVVDGTIGKGDTVKLMNTGAEFTLDEVGVLAPKQIEVRAPCNSWKHSLYMGSRAAGNSCRAYTCMPSLSCLICFRLICTIAMHGIWDK